MKGFIIFLILLVVGVGVFIYVAKPFNDDAVQSPNESQDTTDNTDSAQEQQDQAEAKNEKETVIGKSVEQRDIVTYHFGQGEDEILLIGGIHGGYGWNTSLLSSEIIDYLETSTDNMPANVKVTVIPTMNPDGLFKILDKQGLLMESDAPSGDIDTVPGRFNANDVDLNRNFDCDWQEKGTWQSREVSGGSEAFSEPESKAVKAYVDEHKPIAVVVYYAAAGGVFASNCHNGVPAETTEITNLYAKASGYKAFKEFNFYEITGDMVNWMAKENIPAISVLLTNHTDTEFDKNKAGIEALIKRYAKPTEAVDDDPDDESSAQE